MERGVVRGKVFYEDDLPKVRLAVLAAPGTGGRSRARGTTIMEIDVTIAADVEEFLDTELPDNDLTP